MFDKIVTIYLYLQIAYELLERKQKWIFLSFNVACVFVHLRLLCWYKGMISMCFALKVLVCNPADYVFSINLIPVTTEIVWFISIRELLWSILHSFSLTIQSPTSHFLISIKWKTCWKERRKRIINFLKSADPIFSLKEGRGWRSRKKCICFTLPKLIFPSQSASY